ncbi:MAG TPA: RNA-binding protein [Acidobacteriota bacterium]|nr:RNA-binding protein [Acidobacteriota bacterium]
MSMRIYVGNLPFSSSEGDVRQLFESYGEVSSIHMPEDRATGRPRGFAFVEMSQEDAETAIENLNGQDHGGRSLTVNQARPRNEGRGRGGHGGGGGRW